MASGETDRQIDYGSDDQRKRYLLLLLLVKCFSRWVAVMITPTGCGGLLMGPINLNYSYLMVNLWKEPNNFLFVISCTSSNNYDVSTHSRDRIEECLDDHLSMERRRRI
jgi:hypothetical protein